MTLHLILAPAVERHSPFHAVVSFVPLDGRVHARVPLVRRHVRVPRLGRVGLHRSLDSFLQLVGIKANVLRPGDLGTEPFLESRYLGRDEQRKVIKYHHLVADCLIFHNVCSLTRLVQALQRQGKAVPQEALACISPYLKWPLFRRIVALPQDGSKQGRLQSTAKRSN